ncbi:ABC transporter substrate-binding protein [Bacillus sp. FJAT-45350]|uniref:ABC transporter substrate-binding protein n=1 Tax=Bacillus sp. FJAT-45350 TaxID=2011014 RepID=UPI0015C91E5C|nr:ABC transporter substrate-binding protein [Bacillus sp. FJAT-45350]
MKNNLLLCCITALLAIILIGCSSSGSSSSSSESTGGSETSEENSPVEIRFGGGYAAEEPFWLLEIADDTLAPNLGKTYTLDVSQFRANADRLNAYQAGQLDGGSLGQAASMIASEQGVEMKVVAGLTKDTPNEGFNNAFMALADSDINSVEDLKGKTIGLSDFRAPADFWARNALRSAGLEPDRDVSYAITPIPAMTEAVKAGRIDVGLFPQPFAAAAEASGEFKIVFTSKTGVPVDEDFLVIFLNPTFIEENESAVRDFLADYTAVVEYYMENGEEARQMLIDAGKVDADPEIYVGMTDSNRSAYLEVDAWPEIQQMMLKDGWLSSEVDLDELIDISLLP